MWKHDFTHVLKDHILLFGDIKHMGSLIESIRRFTFQEIVYVSDKT
jgi:hypothetical protein